MGQRWPHGEDLAEHELTLGELRRREAINDEFLARLRDEYIRMLRERDKRNKQFATHGDTPPRAADKAPPVEISPLFDTSERHGWATNECGRYRSREAQVNAATAGADPSTYEAQSADVGPIFSRRADE